MRLRLLCAIGVLIFLIDTAPAQKRNNNQLIQYSLNAAGLGMDFSYQPPFIQTRFAANPGDCLSVISDTNGRMLFAAAPGLIYDTTGAVIYDDVTPYYYAIGATQSTLILPRPAHSATYDVVMFQSTPSVTQNVKATWTSVDMSMNGGLGGSTGARIASKITANSSKFETRGTMRECLLARSGEASPASAVWLRPSVADFEP